MGKWISTKWIAAAATAMTLSSAQVQAETAYYQVECVSMFVLGDGTFKYGPSIQRSLGIGEKVTVSGADLQYSFSLERAEIGPGKISDAFTLNTGPNRPSVQVTGDYLSLNTETRIHGQRAKLQILCTMNTYSITK